MSRQSLIVVAALVTAAYWMGSGSAPSPSPSPEPEPLPNRPRLMWVIKAAKNLLWVAAFFEPPPAQSDFAKKESSIHAHPGVDEQGFPIVDHTRGL
jgi:hypothetical protein